MKLFGFLSVYGLLIALAVCAAVIYMQTQLKRLALPEDTALDFALWAVPFGVIGARIYYCAFNWAAFADAPISVLFVWEGGLAIYGGIMGGAAGLWLMCRRKQLDMRTLLDLVAPGLLLAQAIGRWGNYFNQEAHGAAVTDPSLQFFPYAVIAEGEWVQATFFYESLWNLLGFFLLHGLRRKFKKAGSLFLLYCAWYGLGRFFIEGLRTDSLMWGPFRVSRALSLVLVIVGLGLLAKREWLGGRQDEA